MEATVLLRDVAVHLFPEKGATVPLLLVTTLLRLKLDTFRTAEGPITLVLFTADVTDNLATGSTLTNEWNLTSKKWELTNAK